MAKTRSTSDKIMLFLKGLAMGTANKVPGVSGGTVAFVFNFYKELIYTLKKFNLKALKLIIAGRFKSFSRYINGTFLALVMGGSMFSYFSVSKLLDYFLKNYEIYVWSAFFGMVIGSVYYISKRFNDWQLKNCIGIAIGVLIGVSISLMPPAKENSSLWYVFLCGIIGVSGMTLPGLSGSFILILMGNYVLLLVDSVNVLYDSMVALFTGNFSFFSNPKNTHYLKVISVFTVGSGFGLVVFSHILGYVLKHWHQLVTAIIIGFITGSLGTVWPWKHKIYKTFNGDILFDKNGQAIVENFSRYLPDIAIQQTWIAIAYIIFGILLVLFLDMYENRYKA